MATSFSRAWQVIGDADLVSQPSADIGMQDAAAIGDGSRRDEVPVRVSERPSPR